jgi:hypothetical protein
MTVLMLPPGGIRRSMLIAACVGLGRSCCSCLTPPALHGEIARVPGRCSSAGPAPALAIDLLCGPTSSAISDSLKLPLRTSRQCVDSVPGTNSSDGCTLSSTVRPSPIAPECDQPEHQHDDGPRPEDGHGDSELRSVRSG